MSAPSHNFMEQANVSPTRYTPPRLTDILPRENLYAFLDERWNRKLTIVSARAGQGKSTTIADYLNSRKRNFFWYNLDAKDHVLPFLVSSILRYFAERKPDERKDKPSQTEIPSGASPEESASGLARFLSRETVDDFTLVFDNFQEVNEAEYICRFFLHLVEALPLRFHVIIVSRTHPALNLVRFRSEKELTELSDRDLWFGCQEISSLFHQIYRVFPDESLIASLYDRFAGWITGYIFILDTVFRQKPDDQRRTLEGAIMNPLLPEIADFFRTEVMNSVAPELQDEIVRFSPLPCFDSAGIEAATGKSGAAVINALISGNLFVQSVEETPGTYAFHPLFSEFLRGKISQMKEKERIRVYNSLAEYLVETGRPEIAIDFYVKAGLFSRAKDVFIEIADPIFNSTDLERVRALSNLFPEEQIDADPYLIYYHDISTNLLKPFTTRKRLISLLDFFHKNRDYDRESTIYSVLLSNYFFYQTSIVLVRDLVRMATTFFSQYGHLLQPERREILETLIPLGKWWLSPAKDEAFEAALRAEETSSRLHNEEAFLTARLVLARIYLEKGEYSQAEQLLKKTERLLIQSNKTHPYIALLRFYLGDTYFYLGKIPQAIEQVEKGLYGSTKEFAFRLYLELNLVLYNIYLANIDSAEYLFDGFREIDVYENLYIKYYLLYLLHMLIAYRGGNERRADYYFKRLMEPENENLLRSDFPYSFIALSETAIYLRKEETAREILLRLLGEIQPETHPFACATVYAILGYLEAGSSGNGGNGGDSLPVNEDTNRGSWFGKMEAVLRERGYENLDICEPRFLKRIAEVSGSDVFSHFPRLQGSEEAEEDTEGETAEMEIQTLGDFRVFIHGVEIPNSLLSSQKRVMDLFKLLVVNRKNGVMKERIYELFWPRYSYKSARDNLNTIIYRLRKILGDSVDILVTDANSIKFRERSFIVDVDRFLEQSRKGREAENAGDLTGALGCYSAAVHLYRGDFLESDLYYDFIRDERESLRNAFRLVLFRLTRLSLDAGEYLKSLEWGKRLVQLDPLCEPAFRLLMIASAFLGNRSELPRIYDRLNQKLMECYKVQADQKTLMLKERLLAGDIPEPSLWQQESIF